MPQNPFDGLSMSVFDIVTTTMGYDAEWSPSNGGATQSGRVLFSKPTQHLENFQYRDEYGRIEYEPNQYRMEYKEPLFPDLKNCVDNNKTEIVTINDNNYYVMKVHQVFDGRTYIAIIQPTV